MSRSSIRKEAKNNAYQWQNLSWSLLNRVRKLIVEQADMSQVDFQLELFEQQVCAQLISVTLFSHTLKTCDKPAYL